MTIVRNIGYVHIFVDLVLVNTYWSIELAGTPKEPLFVMKIPL
jgi:hypothetical protein